MIPLDKYGWPVEQIIGHPITNWVRNLVHARRWITEAEWRERERQRNAPFVGMCGTPMDSHKVR